MSSSAEVATTTDKKMIELRSSDGQIFVVEENVAVQSQTLKNMIEDNCADDAIPLRNVTGNILAMVIEYCKRHVKPEGEDPSKEDDAELKAFDADLVKDDETGTKSTLYDLIMAANYLDIKGLLDLTCQTVADIIKGKTPEEIRKIFNIKNDFTPEEEAEIRNENAWAFE